MVHGENDHLKIDLETPLYDALLYLVPEGRR